MAELTLGTAIVFAINFVLCIIFTALASSYNEMAICQDRKYALYLCYGFATVQLALLVNQNPDNGHFFPLFVLTILDGMIIILLVFTGICFSSDIFGILTIVLLIGAACIWVIFWLYSFASFVDKADCSWLNDCQLNCDYRFNQVDGTCEGCCCRRGIEAPRRPSVQITTSRPPVSPQSTPYPAPVPEATPPPRRNIPSLFEVTSQRLDAMSTSDLKEFIRQNNISDDGVGGRDEMRDLILAIKFSGEDSATCGGGGGGNTMNTTNNNTTTENTSGTNNAPVISRLDSRGVARECNICTNLMGRGHERNIAIITHCKHLCCTECIERIMVEGNSKCPMCTRPFTGNDIIIARDVRGGVFS